MSQIVSIVQGNTEWFVSIYANAENDVFETKIKFRSWEVMILKCAEQGGATLDARIIPLGKLDRQEAEKRAREIADFIEPLINEKIDPAFHPTVYIPLYERFIVIKWATVDFGKTGYLPIEMGLNMSRGSKSVVLDEVPDRFDHTFAKAEKIAKEKGLPFVPYLFVDEWAYPRTRWAVWFSPNPNLTLQ